MASYIFILRYFNVNTDDNIKVFQNVDAALDKLRELLEFDSDLMNYEISKYELNYVSSEFEHISVLDLDELIDMSDEEDENISIIISDSDDNESSE